MNPIDNSVLRALVRDYANKVDHHLEQEPGQTMREVWPYPYPLLAATQQELMQLYHQLLETNDVLREVQ
jgi:hypothetical protein